MLSAVFFLDPNPVVVYIFGVPMRPRKDTALFSREGRWDKHSGSEQQTLPSSITNGTGSHLIGTPKIYTTTGLGLRKNREMAGVDDLVVFI